jgi:hypothetical protein
MFVSLFRQRQDEIKQLFKKSVRYGNDPDHIGDRQITERLLTLEALMSTLTAFEASEPKDTIYAILWLACDLTLVSKG